MKLTDSYVCFILTFEHLLLRIMNEETIESFLDSDKRRRGKRGNGETIGIVGLHGERILTIGQKTRDDDGTRHTNGRFDTVGCRNDIVDSIC